MRRQQPPSLAHVATLRCRDCQVIFRLTYPTGNVQLRQRTHRCPACQEQPR